MQFVKSAPELNLAMYGWIKGTPVQEVHDEDIVQALRFTEKLYQLERWNSPLPKAATCLCLDDLLIRCRRINDFSPRPLKHQDCKFLEVSSHNL